MPRNQNNRPQHFELPIEAQLAASKREGRPNWNVCLGSYQCTRYSGLVRCLFDRQGNPKFGTRAYNGLNVYPSMVFFNDAIGE